MVQRHLTEQGDGGTHNAPHADDITKNVKLEVSDFSRNLSPKAFIDWLNSLDDCFAWYNMNDAQKIAFTKVKLKGPACILWQSIENSELTFGHLVMHWEEMKQKLKQNSLLSDYIDPLHKGHLNLQQGNYSLDECTNMFQDDIVCYNLQADNGLTINKYTEGMTDVNEAYCKARKACGKISSRGAFH